MDRMKNPYMPLVDEYARLYRDGARLPLGNLPTVAVPGPGAVGPSALIFSPHPDDEGIIGGLALRLQREHGWRIKNVAVTLGSLQARRAERLAELRGACAYLGFDLIVPDVSGWEQVTPEGRANNPGKWDAKVAAVADLLRHEKPTALFFPHVDDWNGTHIGTHWLVMDALARVGAEWSGFLVETEFWGQMARPNLMVEVSASQVADQVAGVSFHAGEVLRNPFHLRLPAWMQDNVRRGSELVGGQGGTAPSFDFATLYRLRSWRGGQIEELFSSGKALPVGESTAALFHAL
jgi:N-acetylglucosamine malate deacetylase 1